MRVILPLLGLCTHNAGTLKRLVALDRHSITDCRLRFRDPLQLMLVLLRLPFDPLL